LKRLRANINKEKVQSESQEIGSSPTAWAEWIELKQTLANFGSKLREEKRGETKRGSMI